jgi:hypothetical protein
MNADADELYAIFTLNVKLEIEKSQ